MEEYEYNDIVHKGYSDEEARRLNRAMFSDNFLADAYAKLPVTEKPWSCMKCNERFATVEEISAHQNEFHKVTYSDEDIAGRVVVVPPSQEFLGNRENYHFTRNYSTHAEAWVITKSDDPHSMTVEDRDGGHWGVWHFFFHTGEQADRNFFEVQQDCNAMGEPVWQVIL